MAAILPADVRLDSAALESKPEQDALLQRPDIAALPELTGTLDLIDYPHQIVQCHLNSIHDHLNRRIASGQLTEIRDGASARDTELGDLVATDTSQGPIAIEARSRPAVRMSERPSLSRLTFMRQ